MTTENTTPNRSYQLPFASNELADDVGRLIAAITAIDVDVAAMLVSIAGKALAAHSHVIADTTGLQAALDSKQDETEKGNANGYAGLDATGKVPSSQLPAALFGALTYQGDWNANTNTPTIPAAAAGNKGWYYMVSVAGATSVGGITDWKIGDWAVSDGTKWVKIDNTDAVASVAGLVGVITAAALKTALAIAVADITDASANGRSLISAANYATMFGLLKQVATDTATGVVEIATAGEVAANTNSDLAMTTGRLKDALAWFGMTDAATIAVDHAAGPNQKVTLGGNRAFGTPANPKIGTPLNLWVVQDATGSRVPTFASEFDFGDYGVPAGSTGASQADLYCFICLTATKYAFLGIRKRVD